MTPPPAKLCLKARPTPGQLADRLRPVDGALPDGLELYLDLADIADQAAMDGVVGRIERCHLPRDFALLIEGPVGSFDGGFFDPTRSSQDDRLVLDRLAQLAGRLRARAVNIHLIAPSDDLSRLTVATRDRLLARAVSFFQRFAEVTLAAGAVPTVENMPPVMRMRVGGWYFSPIGMASDDLRWLVDRVPGLRILPDTSHAGLYLTARALARQGSALRDAAEPWQEPLFAYLRQLPDEAPDLLGYCQSLAPAVANAQVSNSAGLLGEGLPYGDGDYDLDPVIAWLGRNTEHIVAETLEPDNDNAVTMRDALRRMRLVLG